MYNNVTVNWIPGHDPTLFVYINTRLVEQLDLTSFKSLEGMHTMMLRHGFPKKCKEGDACQKVEL